MELVPVKKILTSKLIKAKWNYKTDGTDEQITKLCNSVEYQKSLGVIAVRQTRNGKYEIIDGNHRLDAIKKLKLKRVNCEDFGKITKGKAVLIAKQRNTVWFEDDVIKFSKLLKEDILKESTLEELENLLPTTKDILQAQAQLSDFDWEQFNKSKEGDENTEDYAVVKIKCPAEVLVKWIEWQARCKDVMGYDSETKCFEFAITEALNIPVQSLS